MEGIAEKRTDFSDTIFRIDIDPLAARTNTFGEKKK